MLGCACDGDHDPACASRKAATLVVRHNSVLGAFTNGPAPATQSEGYREQPCDCGWRHDPACAVAVLDAQSGEAAYHPAGVYAIDDKDTGTLYGNGEGIPRNGRGMFGYGDTGGASRFFYVAKASRDERERGLDGLDRRSAGVTGMSDGGMPIRPDGSIKKTPQRKNHHPTVKPVDLMQWLVRLVTPPGGLILDPFVGSGTTGIAAMREGFRFLGIDQDAEYCEIARARIVGDAPLFNTGAEVRKC